MVWHCSSVFLDNWLWLNESHEVNDPQCSLKIQSDYNNIITIYFQTGQLLWHTMSTSDYLLYPLSPEIIYLLLINALSIAYTIHTNPRPYLLLSNNYTSLWYRIKAYIYHSQTMGPEPYQCLTLPHSNLAKW